MDDLTLTTILRGAQPHERLVAVEVDDNHATLFQRTPAGAIVQLQQPFAPWLLTDAPQAIPGAVTSELHGDGYRYCLRFPGGWRSFQEAASTLRNSHVNFVRYASPAKQFLVIAGITLFHEMVFDDLNRMQIDIETESLDPGAASARVFMVSVSDNRGFTEVLVDDEARLLHRLIDVVQMRDPDVIEGHNIYSFDLPYLLARFRHHGIPALLGRDRKEAVVGQERNCAIGTNSRPFVPTYVWGRHIIDTLLQVQRFDWSRGQVSSYGLKECARVYGIAAPHRVYLDRAEIMAEFKANPQKVAAYARQDAEETSALAALVAPTEFYQTQIVPDTFQNVAVTGNGEKINAVLLRAYLQKGHAIPKQSPAAGYPGGYSNVRITGTVRPIVKADVESLYPSLMLTQGIKPKSDTLDIFLPLLSELTSQRLQAKRQAKAAAVSTPEHAFWDGLQNSYKSLINSFYGYIGGPFYFNDYAAARRVTEAGREIVQQIADDLERHGSRVVEIDTDGVYFQPPAAVTTEEHEVAYIDEIGRSLPSGIRLAHDGSYAAMLSLKIKNYVLVDRSGRKIYKGSSLRSRSDENYGKAFMARAVDLLLDDKTRELAAYYQDTQTKIRAGEVPISDLAKRERVTEKMLSSGLRKRAASAIKEHGVRQGEFVSLYQKPDKTLGLLENYANDEDREYYAEKLYKFALRLKEALPPDQFDVLFPKPVPARKTADPSQGTLDLFSNEF